MYQLNKPILFIKGFPFLLLYFFSVLVNADSTVADNNLSLWLQQSSQQNTQLDHSPETFVYRHNEFTTHFNSPESTLSLPEVGINEYGFRESQMKTTKSNERKLLRRLSDKLKVNVFQRKGRKQRHNVYYNTVKQEFVSKTQFGKARYEIRVSDEQSEAHFRYEF
jgi:hypothetical protein